MTLKPDIRLSTKESLTLPSLWLAREVGGHADSVDDGKNADKKTVSAKGRKGEAGAIGERNKKAQGKAAKGGTGAANEQKGEAGAKRKAQGKAAQGETGSGTGGKGEVGGTAEQTKEVQGKAAKGETGAVTGGKVGKGKKTASKKKAKTGNEEKELAVKSLTDMYGADALIAMMKALEASKEQHG